MLNQSKSSQVEVVIFSDNFSASYPAFSNFSLYSHVGRWPSKLPLIFVVTSLQCTQR